MDFCIEKQKNMSWPFWWPSIFLTSNLYGLNSNQVHPPPRAPILRVTLLHMSSQQNGRKFVISKDWMLKIVSEHLIMPCGQHRRNNAQTGSGWVRGRATFKKGKLGNAENEGPFEMTWNYHRLPGNGAGCQSDLILALLWWPAPRIFWPRTADPRGWGRQLPTAGE